MSWLYVPGLEESSLESSSPLAEDPDVWVVLSGKPTRRRFSRALRLRPGIRTLCGTISQPSTASRIAAKLIASLPASRASRIRSRGKGGATRTNELSGPNSSGSRKSASQRSSSSRTSPNSSSTSRRPGGSFEDWASSLLRRCYTRPRKQVRSTTDGVCFSSLPTPSAQSYGSNRGGAAGRVGPVRQSLEYLVRALPTPTAGDAKASGASGYSTASGRHSGTTLTDAVCGAASAGRHGKLNPRLSEWMMGLPIGLTAFDALATESYRSWWRQHSQSLRALLESRSS